MVIEVLPADTQGTLNTLLYRGLFLINIPVSVSPIITPLLTFLAETRIYREKAATAREITFLRASDRDITLVTWLPSRKSRLRDLHAYLPNITLPTAEDEEGSIAASGDIFTSSLW